MRRGNGQGSVYKLKGKRRKPWAAMVTTGYVLQGDGELKHSVQKRQALGFYKTKTEAQKALNAYTADPYELGWTFKQVYEAWEKTKDIEQHSLDAYKRSYERFYSLHNKKFADLRVIDLERVINLTDTTPRNKSHMKLLLSQLYKFALKYDIVQKNLSERFSIEQPSVQNEHIAFTDEEIKELWNDGCFEAQISLIMIYTGVRIGELLKMEISDDKSVMIGGSKTKAGRNRTVPIREKIRPFMDFDQDVTYNAFYLRVNRYLKAKGHTPHDCRVTFATKYKNADPTAIKLIMGHAITDITKGVYTKYTPDELLQIVESIDF